MDIQRPTSGSSTSELGVRLLWLIGVRMLVVASVTIPYLLYNPDQISDPTLLFFIAIASVQSLAYIVLLRVLRNWPEIQAYIQFCGDLLFISLLIFKLDVTSFSILYIFIISVAAVFLNRTGVLIGMVQIMLPFMVFPLYSVMSRIDHAYVQAAANLGARPIKSFFRVYLPLSAPGVITGSMLVFIISLGYFITPALLGGRKDVMIAQLIQQQVADFGNWALSSALAVILLVGTGLIFAVVHKIFKVGPDPRL